MAPRKGVYSFSFHVVKVYNRQTIQVRGGERAYSLSINYSSFLMSPLTISFFRFYENQTQHSTFCLCSPGQSSHPSFSGEFGSQRLASDFSLRRRSGRDQGSCHQCRAGDDGERGQDLPQTGEGEPDGRVEVLHFLWVSGIPPVDQVEVRMEMFLS